MGTLELEESVSVLNCWEYMLCGREPGGANAEKMGVCPAAVDERFGGRHRGINGGRACWVAAGTASSGTIECTFAKKGGKCCTCDFYKIVRSEEGNNLHPTICLMKILENKYL